MNEWRVTWEYIDPDNPSAYSQENAVAREMGNHNGTEKDSLQRDLGDVYEMSLMIVDNTTKRCRLAEQVNSRHLA